MKTIAVLVLAGAGLLLGQQPGAERPASHAVRGMRGAVAAGTGFAVDAGVAAMFAAAVAEYSHFAFGGEAPIPVHTRSGEVKCISGLGRMPKLATANFFRTRQWKPGEIGNSEPGGLKGMVPTVGISPALVPGMVDGGRRALIGPKASLGFRPGLGWQQPSQSETARIRIDEANAASDTTYQSLLQAPLDAIVFGMNPRQAVEAPRVQTRPLVSSFDNHAMRPGDLLPDERIQADVASALAGRSHQIEARLRTASGAAPVMISPAPNGIIEAGADPYGYRAARAW